jgi:DNA polymerase-4
VSSAVPVTDHRSPITASVGFICLPHFQAEVEAKLLGGSRTTVVIHQRGRIVSLEERGEAAGLTIGMRLSQAQAICPQAEFVPLAAERYRPFWLEVLDLCVAHMGSVEPGEPGEVFVDLACLKRPTEALEALQQAIEQHTGLTCRTTGGPSKLVAKLRTGANLPDALPVTALWPLDRKTLEHLQALGIMTIGVLRSIPSTRLAEHFGAEARHLHDLARGIDHSPVQPLYPPREIVARQALPGGTDDPAALDGCLRALTEKVARELRRRQEACGRVLLWVTPDESAPVSASLRLRDPSQEARDLLRACRALLPRFNLSGPVAAMTLEAEDCRRDTNRQLNLFYDDRALNRRRQRTRQALAVIRECFGQDIAVLGAEMELPRRERVLAALS